MHPTPQRSHLRPLAARLGLAALFVLSVFTLTQCRMVGDRLTGIEATLLCKRTPNCIADCQKIANQAIRAESEYHVSQVKACGSDDNCKKAEAERHREAVKSIQAQRRACMGGCHHQGGGHGGD